MTFAYHSGSVIFGGWMLTLFILFVSSGWTWCFMYCCNMEWFVYMYLARMQLIP